MNSGNYLVKKRKSAYYHHMYATDLVAMPTN